MEFSEKSLDDLAKNVFSEKYEFIKGPVQVKGGSGKSWTFDAVVKSQLNTFGVFIRDWKNRFFEGLQFSIWYPIAFTRTSNIHIKKKGVSK
ncbi:MAG: hypothetical protein ACW97V_09240 [Promethearchaeota archaeon]|jgi:hypothetical protein